MKQISNYITEKFRINSNTAKSVKKIKNKIGQSTRFTEDEIEEINYYCSKLEITPDIITNYTYYLEDNPRRGGAYNSSIIILGYYINKIVDDKQHDNNEIVIKKDSEGNHFIVKFKKVNVHDSIYFPEDNEKYFNSIKECFDCIKENWDKLKFSEIIKKYK